MKPEKVLILAGQLGIGGAERELVTFLSGLNNVPGAPKIMVASLTPGGEFANEIEALSGSRISSPLNARRMTKLFWIHRLIAEEQPDLVHCWHLFPMLYLKLRFRRTRIPILGFLQTIPEQALREIRHPRLFSYLVNAPSGLVSNSAAALEDLEKMGISVEPSVVVHNGVDKRFFKARACDEAIAQRDSSIVIVAVGRLIPRKRTDWMLRTIRDLRDRGFDATLWVIGDGPERGPLERQARDLRIERSITFWGARNDVDRVLPGADIFLHAAWAEGLPNSVQEALAAGLPVVATRTSGIPEILDDGHEGRLFDVNDYVGCQEALIELMSDRRLRMDMGQRARARAERDYSPEVMAASLLDFYRDVLDGWPVARRR